MKNPAESWVLRAAQLGFTPSTVILLSFLAFSLAGGALSSNPQPHDCEPRHCGNGLNISYPFWITGRQPLYCGYPGFDVACKGDAPVVDEGTQTYFIRDIFNDNMSAVIIAEDRSSSCPYPRHNLSLTRTVFNVSSINRELFFYLNCTKRLPGLSVIECADNERGRVSLVAERPVPANVNVSCESVLAWPFLAYGASEYRRYESLLRNEFLLEWKAPNCSECRHSGGRCGYNRTNNEFMCICNDRVHRVSCNGYQTDIRENKTVRKILIGLGAGAGGFLLACFLCILLYRRRKMRAQTGSSTMLFRTTSSEPSSKKDPEMGGSTHYPTHLFKYEELHEATNGFSPSNELGDGGFGTVYKGKLRDGRIVAVKRLYENNYKRVEQFMNEVAILNLLRHPNLVTLYGCTSRHSRELLLVYEYVPNGTVADHLHGHRAPEGILIWPIRLSIAVETATALAYLHSVEPQIIHRDVKTNNILLDDNFHVKVADFGLSRLFPIDVTHVSTAPQGTPGYVDPEYHQCYQLTDKSDVYSFGVVLVELISSKPAVDITRHRHEINLASMAINKIQSGALHELVDQTLEFETDWEVRRMIKLVAELAFRCLQGEKEMRPSMEDVLEVLHGIQDCQDRAERSGDADHGAADDMSLLKNNAPVSPDSVMDKWTSRTTTPNASG